MTTLLHRPLSVMLALLCNPCPAWAQGTPRGRLTWLYDHDASETVSRRHCKFS
jgi:hypothetical protein